MEKQGHYIAEDHLRRDDGFTVRPFEDTEWPLVRALRLESQQAHPGVFYGTYETDSAYAPSVWQDWIGRAGKSRVFGLFAPDGTPIGLTAVNTVPDDTNGRKTAELGASYIRDEYKGLGLSAMLYKIRLDWAQDDARYDRIIVSHRLNNEISRRAILANGFKFSHEIICDWPDGAREPKYVYEYPMKDTAPAPSFIAQKHAHRASRPTP